MQLTNAAYAPYIYGLVHVKFELIESVKICRLYNLTPNIIN